MVASLVINDLNLVLFVCITAPVPVQLRASTEHRT
jgi:hypothetical protein